MRNHVAAALTALGASCFLISAGLGLAGQFGWFLTGIVAAPTLLVTALLIGCYVPQQERSMDR